MASLKNKTALVTGGARRIGREICLKLADMGYDIVITYLSSKVEAEKLKDKINSMGRKCFLKRFDLTESEKISVLMKEILDEAPGLELIVNNASVFEESQIKSTSLEQLDNNLSIHLRSPFMILKEFAEKVENGQVINILDTRITKNRTKYFGYLISKKALADFTRLAASSLGPGIRVNGIAPGLILPPEGESDDYIKQLASKIPAQRKGELNDITAALEFLVENDYVTGQIIFLDGGEHLM